MAWVVWGSLSCFSVLAAYLVAVAAYRDRSSLERAVVTLVVTHALLMIDIQLCGLTGNFAAWPLGLVGVALFGVVASVAFFRAANLRATVLHDLRAPYRLVIDVWRDREPALLTLAPMAACWFVVLRMVWYFKSWTWDPVWYHVPVTSYAIQNRSIGWIPTHNIYTQGYPHSVELLAAWNCVFPRDNRFDDSSQLPFAVLGMLVVAAWARRVGASRSLAAGLGAAWFLLPPVFLQSHSTHVDVATGALLSAALLFISDENSARSRWLCLISMGLYLGCKFTGAFHLALLAPWLSVRALQELRRAGSRWPRVSLSIVGSILAVLALGIYHYVENYVYAGNPTWPFELKVPFRAQPFPGPVNLAAMWEAPGGSPYFWGAPGAFVHMLKSWFDPTPFYAPDVRSGGLGLLFRWLLLPCTLIVAADVLRLRELRRGLPVLALFLIAIGVPGAWWARFTIGAGTAALVCFALVHQQLPKRWAQAALSLALVALTTVGYADAYVGFIQYPKQFEAARNADATLRSALQIDTFLWPTEAGLLRERELKEGDIVTYDESCVFMAELFNRDYRSKVTFVSSAGDPQAFLQRVKDMKARWVGVARFSPAADALKAAGAEWLFIGPPDFEMWRMPSLQ
ncbi:MAG TPA: hypothetical protein VFX59_03885 [Polyangiales bacterium]|nr:hypothetical protein [Polyangiales bacterium]